MNTLNDVHIQFASFFNSEHLQPFAYLVSRKLSEGHICLPMDELEDETADLPNFFNGINADRRILLNNSFVSCEGSKKQPFVFHNNRLYLQRYFHYESMILNRIAAFVEAGNNARVKRITELEKQKDFIKDLFKPQNKTAQPQTDWQLAAAITAVLNNFSIITGGPGTGKTTTVAKILAILFSLDPELNVSLAAPTGKAAARMAESLKSASLNVDQTIVDKFQLLEPFTIHRLLKYVPDSPYFRHNKNNPLTCDVLIVDESSMIDVALFAKLLDAVGPQTRLILLGDKDQLASVEAGSLFGDLCQALQQLNIFSPERAILINSFIDEPSRQIPADHIADDSHPLFQHLVELKYSHRFKSDEGIGKFSAAVIQNNRDAIKGFLIENADGQVMLDTKYTVSVFEKFVSGYQDYISEPDVQSAFDKLKHLRILCAIREGEQGLYAVNRRVEKFLSDSGLISLKGEFYEHRPVIINQNNYALGLYNGDIGIVRPDDQGVLKVWFEGKDGPRGVLPGLISNAETVYAMTIHKSQGSEFNKVLMLLPAIEDISILTRELLYTGITRAKSEVFIQATEAVILQAAQRQVKRASGIAQRFLQNITQS